MPMHLRPPDEKGPTSKWVLFVLFLVVCVVLAAVQLIWPS